MFIEYGNLSHTGNGISDEYHVIRHVMNLEAVNTYEGEHSFFGRFFFCVFLTENNRENQGIVTRTISNKN